MRGLGILKKNNAIAGNFKQVDSLLQYQSKMVEEVKQVMTQQDERADSARMSSISGSFPNNDMQAGRSISHVPHGDSSGIAA